MARLLALDPRPTGVVAISDLLAIGAIRELRRAGVSVPAGMAVVGMDDIPAAATTDPPLTTIALPARAMGAEAIAALEDGWAVTPVRARRLVLGVDLVIRESCGPHAS
jgi:DNA-binding LacI/PurR family transcriptional regulator